VSWPLVDIGDVAFINPRLPKDTDESQEVTFLGMASISEDGTILNQEQRVLSDTKKGFTYFECNDVLLAKITPCFENGKAVHLSKLNSQIGFGSTEFHVLRPHEGVLDAKYLFYMVWSKPFRFYGEHSMSGAAGQKRVSADFIKGYKIPLPFPEDSKKSIKEQKRIADILDKADGIRRKRQQAIDLADEFLRATFLDMFGDPVTNPKEWPARPWREVLRIVNGRNQKAVAVVVGQYPICGSGGEMGRARDWLVQADSVLVGRKGNINKPILMKEKFWNVDTAFGLEPERAILSHNYLFWFCKFFDFERLNKAVTIPSLTKVDLLEIKIPLPPMEMQARFDTVVDGIGKILAKQEEMKSNQLIESLSKKAFSGELT
jgi:type I restriction enzyme S subunit